MRMRTRILIGAMAGLVLAISMRVYAAPTTQPASVLESTIGQTDIAKYIRGEKEVTLHDVTQLWFWVGTIQNFAEALIAFIPRLMVAIIFLFVFWIIYRAFRRLALGSM